jgi:hypothetical protein
MRAVSHPTHRRDEGNATKGTRRTATTGREPGDRQTVDGRVCQDMQLHADEWIADG